MPSKLPRLIPFVLLVAGFTIASVLPARNARPVYAGLTVHEWGTFTSIAGRDGQAVEWSALNGSTDLPGFVEHYRGDGFKLGLRGTVRMETPVLYFYDSREENVSVKVSFSKGVITEWYPRASHVEPAANLFDGSLYQAHPDGSIAWDAVTVSPSMRAEFPRQRQDSHYYAARMTSATPLRVKTPTGEQQEKFLFYRGVSTFRAPISAKLTADGKVQIENGGEEEIPNTILFERRAEKMGYRIGGALAKEAVLEPRLALAWSDYQQRRGAPRKATGVLRQALRSERVTRDAAAAWAIAAQIGRIESAFWYLFQFDRLIVERPQHWPDVPSIIKPRAQPEIIAMRHELARHLCVGWRERLNDVEESPVAPSPRREDERED